MPVEFHEILTARPAIVGAGLEQLHVHAVDGEEGQGSTGGALGYLGEIIGPLGTISDAHLHGVGDGLVPHSVSGLLDQEGTEHIRLQGSVGVEHVALGQQAVGDALGGHVIALGLDGGLACRDHVILEKGGRRAALVGVLFRDLVDWLLVIDEDYICDLHLRSEGVCCSRWRHWQRAGQWLLRRCKPGRRKRRTCSF